MLSVYLQQPKDISIRDIPPPVAGAGQALIKIRAAGICGSDIGAFRGTNPLVSYPRVIGHELAGEVVSIPPNTKGIAVGSHVVLDPYLHCGHCYPCTLGRTNCCEDLQVLGVHVDGGMAEYVVHPADMLVKVPDDMPWELVPLAEPLTIALHGIHRGGLQAGEHIAIFGAGPIGLLAAMCAKVYGAVPIVIDPVQERLDIAQSLGVAHVLPPDESLPQAVAQLTNRRMAEVVMEASGSHGGILASLDIAAYAGRVVLTGWPAGETPLPTALITRKELDVRGARTSAGEFEEAIELIHSGKVDVRGVLTKTVQAAQLPEAVRQLDAQPGSALKIVGLF